MCLILDGLVFWDIFMSLAVQIIYFGKPVGLFRKLIPFLPFSFFVTATLETSSRYGMSLDNIIIIYFLYSLRETAIWVRLINEKYCQNLHSQKFPSSQVPDIVFEVHTSFDLY